MKLLSLPVIAAMLAALSLTACGGGSSSATNDYSKVEPNQPTTLSTKDLTIGTGATVAAGNSVSVSYTGWLWSSTATDNKGTQFDSNVGKAPFSFVVGAGNVIQGWDQGLIGAKTGGTRRLVIPAALAYGSNGSPPSIPPNAALVFEVQIQSVR